MIKKQIKKKTKTKTHYMSGFSLIEMLVYITILTAILVFIISLVIALAYSFNSVRVSLSINQAATIALDRMVREIRNAGDVDVNNSTFGEHPGRLSLQTSVTSTTTAIEFYLDTGTLYVQKGNESTCYAYVAVDQFVPNYCPLGTAVNRKIFVFSQSALVAYTTVADATKGPFAFGVTSGSYNVTLASFDGHDAYPPSTQNFERWYLILKNAAGGVIANTGPINDLPDERSTLAELSVVNTNFIISENVSTVTAFHNEYPSVNPESVHPACVAFDKVVLTPLDPPPTCLLSAFPESISLGESSTLTWSSTNSLTGSIDQGIGVVTPTSGGSINVSPTKTTLYTGTFGLGGTFTSGILTRQDVLVSDLVFNYITNSSSTAVKIELTLVGSKGKVTKTKKFYATATLR